MGRTATATEYAIVDIETTGGHASGNGVTEIAILIHNGHEVTERFESLVNPQQPIPLYIQAMTGITDEMVAGSPVFDELAPRIYALLNGRVFVAHQVNFDYSFLKYHLDAAGYPFTAPKLCTVRMSRQIKPGLRSYSLGRLCDALDIPISNRHRAGGDAQATALLFSRLLTWDTQGVVAEMLKKTSKHQQLPPNLPKEQFEALPHTAGVYYFHDRSGRVIYVGKARDIRNRVMQHFSGHNPNPQRQHFMRHIHSVSCTPCGTELMALLLEAAEIKRLWPAYNRALKRFEPKYALYAYEDQEGYIRLAIGKHGKHYKHIALFSNQLDAVNLLHRLIREFNLHAKRCVFGLAAAGFRQQPTDPAAEDGCDRHTAPAAYNQQVRKAIDGLTQHLPTFAIFDKGRNEGEYSCVWIESGQFYGMGYLSQQADIECPETIKEHIVRYSGSHYMTQLALDYAKRHPEKTWTPGKPVTAPTKLGETVSIA